MPLLTNPNELEWVLVVVVPRDMEYPVEPTLMGFVCRYTCPSKEFVGIPEMLWFSEMLRPEYKDPSWWLRFIEPRMDRCCGKLRKNEPRVFESNS